MCVWVTYPWTCWIWDSWRSATWTSSAPRRSLWRLREPSLPSDRSLSLSMVPALPSSLLQVPPSLPRVPPSLPRVLPSLSSLATPIWWCWQGWWWSFGAPGDAPSSSWHRYFYSQNGGEKMRGGRKPEGNSKEKQVRARKRPPETQEQQGRNGWKDGI